MYLSRYLLVYPSKTRPDRFMLYSTIRGSIVQVSGATLRAARAGTLAGPEGDTLARLGMLVADLDEERGHMRGVIERANGRSRAFRGIVVLNLDCNLNCGYCYEEDFRGSHYMSAATGQLVVETLIRDQISQGKDVSLAFYGGEPLLSQQLICAISEPLQKAATEHGVSYSFNLVTNGTLLNRDTAEKLIPFGLKGAKFTLDGPRDIHDSQRPYASGSGSFDTIVENVAAIWDIVPLQLGGNFRQENYRDFPRLLDHLISRRITGEKFTQVLFGPVTPKAGCSEYGSGCASPNEPWLVEAQLYLREQTLSKGFPIAKQGVSACIVEFDNNLVVNWDGSLYKCPAFMGWQGLSIGSLAEGVTDYEVSHSIGNWKIDGCLDCAYLPLCFGGCRFLSLLQGKTMGDVDCRREFFDASLEDLLQQDLDHPQRPAVAAASKEKPVDAY